MRNPTPNSETLLDSALQALRNAEPDATQFSASAVRVAERLGVTPPGSAAEVDSIAGCDDVQQLLPAYRAGTLLQSRALLVRAHLRDCGVCHRQLRAGAGKVAVDWSVPRAARALKSTWRPRVFGWALAPALALLAVFFFVYRAYWQVPPGVRAEVESVDGTAYRISDNHPIAAGDALREGEQLRTGGGGHAVLRLADGSTVEVNERSVLGVDARGRNMTIALSDGAVIVQAARRDAGHLYVRTPDCRVAVTGTVFSVNSGLKGSRVAVLEGALHVEHSGIDSLVGAGDQISTNTNLSPEPMDQQIAWSRDRDKYLVLIAQFSTLQHRLELIPSPQLRYTSDLLPRVPASTLLYVSIPNFGDFLSQAKTIFNDQLEQSPALQQWWAGGDNGGSGNNTQQLNAMVDKLHSMSQFLGDEVVIVGLRQEKDPGFAVLADVQKNGLAEFLGEQFPPAGTNPGLMVFDENSLKAASVPAGKTQTGGYALIRDHEAVFSNSIVTLKQIDAQLNAGASGFAASDFGQQIEAAYTRGAGILLAADLHQMLDLRDGDTRDATFANSGIEGVRYLVAEHRELDGQPQNHLNLQFSGTRERVASWLAAPAPMGSLGFVTPNAAIAVALLSKDPRAIADDILAMASPDNGQSEGLNEAEAKLKINFRDDIAANLGGEFLLSLDGAVVPMPAWKAVIEVRDAAALEKAIEQLTVSFHDEAHGGRQSHSIMIESNQSGEQRIYSVVDHGSGATLAEYTFVDGYMVITPDRPLLMKALKAHSSGDSLARSAAFKALLPQDENENYSAVAYQNAGPMLTPLLSQFSGDTAAAIKQLTADAKPTAICAWGQDTHIEAASKSRLFGFDFLALQALFNPGNKHANASVQN